MINPKKKNVKKTIEMSVDSVLPLNNETKEGKQGKAFESVVRVEKQQR